MSREYPDFALVAIFINLSFKIGRFITKNFLPSTPSLYLWDNHPAVAVFVLQHYLK